jgi:hypothetical protein
VEAAAHRSLREARTALRELFEGAPYQWVRAHRMFRRQVLVAFDGRAIFGVTRFRECHIMRSNFARETSPKVPVGDGRD